MEIAKYRKTYYMGGLSELEAAQTYDMMAIYLYGNEAKLNFCLTDYSRENIKETYAKVTALKHTSKYLGVDYVSSLKIWRVVLRMKEGKKKTWVKRCQTEMEAAKAYDKAMLYFYNPLDEELNFPNLKEEYLKEDLAIFCYRPAKTNSYPGVSRHPNGRFRAKFRLNNKNYHCGYFDTEEEAYQAFQNKRLELQSNYV